MNYLILSTAVLILILSAVMVLSFNLRVNLIKLQLKLSEKEKKKTFTHEFHEFMASLEQDNAMLSVSLVNQDNVYYHKPKV